MKHLSRIRLIVTLVVAIIVSLIVFKPVSTSPSSETVLIDYPLIFGDGGVRDKVQVEGMKWYWRTTSHMEVNLAPKKYDEPIDHMPTSDNNFINYASYVVLQWYDSVYNVKHFGQQDWYVNNLKEQYKTIVRDVSKQYSMTDIMTNPKTLVEIETHVRDRFKEHIAKTGLKVNLVSINMGKALPNKSVVDEMDRTAAQQQRKKTEEQRDFAEIARKAAETSRANADNAYREKMNLSPEQFVQLESIRNYSQACIKSQNCIIVQGNSPVLVGGK